jgi:hypothetical protein
MVIEAILFLVFVIAVGAVIVKIYEWSQDVLYGPYIGQRSERKKEADYKLRIRPFGDRAGGLLRGVGREEFKKRPR